MESRNTISRINNFVSRRVRRIITIDILEWLTSYSVLKKALNHQVKKKTVLMIEPNRFHSEILPGYCFYFRQMGYDIVLLLRRENFRSGVFSRVSETDQPTLFPLAPSAIRKFLKKINLNQYDLVFITSDTYSEKYGYFGPVWEYWRKLPQGRLGYLIVAHNFPEIRDSVLRGSVDSSHIILLSNFQDQKFKISGVNPNYFGDVSRVSWSGQITFVTIGTVTSRNRSFEQLMTAIKALDHWGISNYRVLIIGRGTKQLEETQLSPKLSILGYLEFPEMYSILEDAHFILPLLDPHNKGHQRYLSGETTGTRQLILGFGIVPVINDLFAEAYGFNSKSSVIYSGTSLAEGMREACGLSAASYDSKVESIAGLRDAVRQKSLQSLRGLVDGYQS